MQTVPSALRVRSASAGDLDAIRRIYNEGIEDRIATLDEDPKTAGDMAVWWSVHQDRYAVLIAENPGARSPAGHR